MSNFIGEFKEFVSRGNVVDMAVGVIIGGAFGKIVSSLVDDIVMPVIGKIIGGIVFTSIMISLDGNKYPTLAAAKEAGAPIIAVGNFMQTVLNFLIIAFVIFIFIRQINRFKRKEEVIEEVTTKICPFCKSEIAIDATRCPHCTSEVE